MLFPEVRSLCQSPLVSPLGPHLPGFFLDSASYELPLLTPCSKAVMSQALTATFSGFQKERRRLGIPKSKCVCLSSQPGIGAAALHEGRLTPGVGV